MALKRIFKIQKIFSIIKFANKNITLLTNYQFLLNFLAVSNRKKLYKILRSNIINKIELEIFLCIKIHTRKWNGLKIII